MSQSKQTSMCVISKLVSRGETKLYTNSTTLFSQQVMTPFCHNNITTKNSILYIFFFPCIKFKPYIESFTQQSTVVGKIESLYKIYNYTRKIDQQSHCRITALPHVDNLCWNKNNLFYNSELFPTCNSSPAAV